MPLVEKEVEALGAFVARTVAAEVRKATEILQARITDLENRKPEKGEPGEKGDKGDKGESGVGIAGAMIDRTGELIVTLANGELLPLGQIVGKDGQPGRDGERGKDGADGLGFDDLEVIQSDVRNFSFVFKRNDRVKSFDFTLPVMLYAGVFQAGNTYGAGDTVTCGGSLWHCNAHTIERPGEQSSDWTLIAKRGRDGKDGGKGAKGDPGANGKSWHEVNAQGAAWQSKTL